MAHDTEKQLQIWREDQERGGGNRPLLPYKTKILAMKGPNIVAKLEELVILPWNIFQIM